MLLALTPAATVSVVQGLDRVHRDENDVRQLLVQSARAAASDEQNMLASAEQILRALANQPAVRDGTANCHKALASSLGGLTYFVNIARIAPNGKVVCSALPLREPVNVSDRSWWPQIKKRSNFTITKPQLGVVSRRVVVAGVLPMHNDAGSFYGAIAIGLEVNWLDAMLRARQLPEGAVAALFDGSGALIAANNQAIAAHVFDHPVTRASAGTLQAASGPNDQQWSYSVEPLVGSDALIGFAMRNTDLFSDTYRYVATDLLLPVLMLGLASLAIWIATDRQVIRWIVYLRRFASAYARGHYAVRPSVEDAPSEFRLLGDTFAGMAAAVQERDRSLRDALAQKSMLIRETHHRVKNNLQIIMSLLSLQAGRLHDPAVQAALRQAQMRVNALALVHRMLHELEDQDTVDLKRLLADLTHQVQQGFGTERQDVRIVLDIASCRVTSDFAVPLTLFTVEAVTNAFKHGFDAGTRDGIIRIALRPTQPGMLRLSVADNGGGIDGAGAGVGSRLIRAFAQQVHGTVETETPAGGGTEIALVFPAPWLQTSASRLSRSDRTRS